MNKKILIGCVLVVGIIMLLPSTSIAESSLAEERLELEKVFKKQSEEIPIIKENPNGPTCILRLLLILRNLIILGFVGIIYILLKGMTNSSA